MNGDKVVERDKILQVMEKYRDYFKEWNADVAFGTNKSNIFYVLAPRNEFETFLFFQTADQARKNHNGHDCGKCRDYHGGWYRRNLHRVFG